MEVESRTWSLRHLVEVLVQYGAHPYQHPVAMWTPFTPDSLMQYGCVHPPVVSHVSWPSCCLLHVQYPVVVVTCVLSDNCSLEAPGAFSLATYTHGGVTRLLAKLLSTT